MGPCIVERAMPDPSRRRFIAGGASLGALTLLTGCDVTDSFSADNLLARISKFNDAVQAAIFCSGPSLPPLHPLICCEVWAPAGTTAIHPTAINPTAMKVVKPPRRPDAETPDPATMATSPK